nr:hypothetical protein [Tanacetum cinerariifolium]
MRCGSGLCKGLCLICKNNQNSLNDSPSISENSSQSLPHINHHCCYECGDPLDGILCKRCTCKSCGKGAHISYNCPPKVSVISNPEPCKNQTIDELPQTCQVFIRHAILEMKVHSLVTQLLILLMILLTFSTHLRNPRTWSENIQQKNKEEEKQITKEQAAKARYWKIPICYDDDEDCTIVITPILSTVEPEDSLRIRDEHLDTIPKKESDEFIKSSVENLVPNPSESKGEHECDVPVCDDFTTFSNLFFDADDDFSFKSMLYQDSLIISSSSKIDSLHDEFTGELIFLKSIPLGIDKADCDPKEEIRLIEKLLYNNSSPRPPEEFISENSDAIIESFSPSPIFVKDSDPLVEEINLFLASDGSIPPGIDNDYSDSEGDNLFLERLLHDDYIPLSEILDFSNVI